MRVESENLIRIDPEDGSLYDGRSGLATMTVFTRTKDTVKNDDQLHFPFGKEENERGMMKIYAKENSAEQFTAMNTPDIADAGGMSTFNAQAQRNADRTAPAAEDELPWGADALSEEEMAAIEAEEAGFTQAKNREAPLPVQEDRAASSSPVRTTVTARQKTDKPEARESVADEVKAKALYG